MKLVAGSYERFLFGYTVKGLGKVRGGAEEGEGEKLPLTLNFSQAAHMGPVKCLAASGSVLASGGMDDIIKVYDLRASKDMGSLLQHDGAITCLKFHGPRGHPTHLFSGGADSNICVWDADEWSHLQTLKGHRKAVNDLTVHNTGRLALSVACDGLLKMWDLVKGRCTFTSRLSEEGSLVAFMPESGKQYTLAGGASVKLFSAESGKEIGVLQHERKVLCMAQSQDNVLLSGTDGGAIHAWDLSSRSRIFSWPDTHAVRVRAVVILPSPGSAEASLSSSSQTLPPLIASTSTDGFIRVWDTRKWGGGSEGKPTPLAEVQTEARLTCLACSTGGGTSRTSGVCPHLTRSRGPGPPIPRKSRHLSITCIVFAAAAKSEKVPRSTGKDFAENPEPRSDSKLQRKEQSGNGRKGRAIASGLETDRTGAKKPKLDKKAGKRERIAMGGGKEGGGKARRLSEKGAGFEEVKG